MSKHIRERSKGSNDVDSNLIQSGLSDSRSYKGSRIHDKPLSYQNKVTSLDSFKKSTIRYPPNHIQGTQLSFKQSSISRGTLQRQHQSIDTDPSAHVVKTASTPKSVTFDTEKMQVERPSTMASIVGNERAKSRKERTFVGGQCAACEELLEHTLQGERVLQFSCGHVAHEACFYEYIKDTDSQYCPTCDAPLGLDAARGGSILDLSKLSNMVRSVAQQQNESTPLRGTTTTPVPWDRQSPAEDQDDGQSRTSIRDTNRNSQDGQIMRIERLGRTSQHSRNNSGNGSSSDYQVQDNVSTTRKHDYDLHAMETNVTEPQSSKDYKIPLPVVTIRSEFPTITRSQNQQSLTCLVTVEVPEAKWRHHAGETLAAPHSPISQKPRTHKSVKATSLQLSRHAQQSTLRQDPPSYELDQLTVELKARVENWHGLEFSRFGKLKLHGSLRVSKDQRSWQQLECYLFGEMLICVKEKRNASPPFVTEDGRRLARCTLKGSILIQKHLKDVYVHPDMSVLTLNLSVMELPTFHLSFHESTELERWKNALSDLQRPESLQLPLFDYEQDLSGTDDEYERRGHLRHTLSNISSQDAPRSATTAPTEYSSHAQLMDASVNPSLHTPLDIVVVIPVSSSMQGLKMSLLKDTLRFLVGNLGERDRMGLVTFGSSQGGVPLVGMTTKSWAGWTKVISSIRPVGQKSLRADVVEGARVAMDLLMQRKAANPVSTIMLISDSSTSDSESVDFVVSRAEAAKVAIYSFGLGVTHKPDSMIELSSRTKASYLYVKDWMMLRECMAGCLGSLQSISHHNAKLRFKLPEGSPAKFVKISGAIQTTKRATGRDAEAILGDLRFGDKRDILVQLVVHPDVSNQEQVPQDHWQSLVSGLEALDDSEEMDDSRVQSVEEIPLLQADLSYTDLQTENSLVQISRPSLLTITVLPPNRKSRQGNRPITPPIPPHPQIVQRRMELLTSDMLTRALTLVSKQQHDRAHHLLSETRTILKGLAKGGLPPIPISSTSSAGSGLSKRNTPPAQPLPQIPKHPGSPGTGSFLGRSDTASDAGRDPATPIPRSSNPPSCSIDAIMMNALDADIEAALEWIEHPAIFGRDSRKGVLQAIGIISSQRAYTFRTASESIWAERIGGIRKMTDGARDWREVLDDGALAEEQ